MGQVVHGASCPWGELSMGRVVHGASCPWGEFSTGRVFHRVSCPWNEFSMGQNDCTAKCHGASCPGIILATLAHCAVGLRFSVIISVMSLSLLWWTGLVHASGSGAQVIVSEMDYLTLRQWWEKLQLLCNKVT
jgi:hypothetical protein